MAFHLRKAPPTDFSDLMDHHECFLIDIHDDPVQFLELPSGNNGDNSHGRLSQMTALDLEQGRPAVKLLLYCKVDRLIFFTDDLRLHLLFAHHEHLVQDHRVDHDHDDPVKDLFPVTEKKLGQ